MICPHLIQKVIKMTDELKLGLYSVRDDTSILGIQSSDLNAYIFSTRDDPSVFIGNGESSEDLILLFDSGNDAIEWSEEEGDYFTYLPMSMELFVSEDDEGIVLNIPSSVTLILDDNVYTMALTKDEHDFYCCGDIDYITYPFYLCFQNSIHISANTPYNKVIIKASPTFIDQVHIDSK